MTAVRLPDAAPTSRAGFVGQSTVVEQSRAVAEVQAAVVVAQQCPRNIQAAIAAMRESCGQPRLAERAFYRYPRAEEVVTGPSVHLARELARCWGNVQYSLGELRRDDEAGESEMIAFAWDVQHNTRAARTFIVKHARDTKRGRRVLTDLRDITENNTNIAARQLREAIFNVLPTWYVEEAKDLCMATLRDGGGRPLPTQVADAVKAFAGKGVTVEQLERKQGRPTGQWTEHDVAALRVVYTSLDRGEVTIAEEFEPPDAPVTKAEIDATAAATEPVEKSEVPPQRPAAKQRRRRPADAPSPSPVAESSSVDPAAAAPTAEDEPPVVSPPGGETPEPEADEPADDGDDGQDAQRDLFDEPATPKQLRQIMAQLRELGVTERDEVLAELGGILGRDLASRKEITVADGVIIVNELRRRVLRLGEPDEPPPDDGEDGP